MSSEIVKNYAAILTSLKEKIRQRQQQASLQVNTQLLELYWEIGHVILQQQAQEGWGAKVIDRLAKDLKADFPEMKGLSIRNVKYMRAFAEAYPDGLFVQAALAQLPWYHHITLLDKVKSREERLFYAQQASENAWSRNVMVHQIESQLYGRQGKAITNFAKTLPSPQSDLAQETLKDPYHFDFLGMNEKLRERDLENALIDNIKRFLLELGKGFAYVGNQYNLNVAGDDYFLDLLFYNTRLHCYVVFELKIGDFTPEYAGKLNFYINAVDHEIKTESDQPTIGVLLCKTPNRTVIKYALEGLEKPLGVADYKLSPTLPEPLQANLPTEEELTQEMEKELPLSPLRQKIDALKAKAATLDQSEVREGRSAETVREVVDWVYYPLHEQFLRQNREVVALFKQERANFFVGLLGYSNREELEEALRQTPTPNQLSIQYRFSGFIKAGTQAFDSWVDVYFLLDEFKYRIALNDKENIVSENLYGPSSNEDEVKQITEIMLEQVVDNINRNLKRVGI